MRTLDGKVVALTGAGSGIGRALALECAARGARVAVSDIDPDLLAGTVELVERAGVRDLHAQVVDVADRGSVTGWADEVARSLRGVNVIVNNAGVALTGELQHLSQEDLDWIVGVNFWGVVHGTQAFLGHLIDSGDGHVVNLSSLFGLLSVPGQSAYNATKYAVRGLSEALREEMLVAGHPVGVTVVHPGGIKTSIARSGRYVGPQTDPDPARTFDEKLARTTPETAARVIVRGVLRNKPRVLIGADAHLLHHFARLTGARYQDVVAKAMSWGGTR